MKIFPKVFNIFNRNIKSQVPRPVNKPLSIELKAVTPETAKKLYSSDYLPLPEQLPINVYQTFVLERASGEPVDVFVKHIPATKSFGLEKFTFYSDKKLTNSLGFRTFRVDNMRGIIGSGSMYSCDPWFAGIGLRGHQLAIEMMNRLKLSNVELKSTMSGYPFHIKCGFNVLENVPAYQDVADIFSRKLPNIAKTLGVDVKILKELVVFSPQKNKLGEALVDTGKTFENFTKYMMSVKKDLPFEYFMPMRLSGEALNEWTVLANHQPILKKYY